MAGQVLPVDKEQTEDEREKREENSAETHTQQHRRASSKIVDANKPQCLPDCVSVLCAMTIQNHYFRS